ncbi:MAG TPA: adenylate/guanylate cyclase domain-containing protein [Roseiflexaceae bacterium]|nr:adenylate/guanylate cyclase domain-containing protein [Roseiflexaceae bacterium]
MNDVPHADSAAAGRLRAYLPADIADQILAGQPLPPERLRAECARLRSELAAIASYIPSAIVREQIHRPAVGAVSGAFWDGSVLFADLSGFTALSERLSTLGKQGAEEISTIINSLFTALVEELDRYRGGLIKFGGDALTAFFDAGVLGDQHALLAGQAALAMQARMAAFDTVATRVGSFQLRLRVGVHSGRVFAAQVGDGEHVELVVTGQNINRVALAQEIAEVGEVVVSDTTLALLPGARTAPRADGFVLLAGLPPVAAPPPAGRWDWQADGDDRAALLGLVERVAALHPYLPCSLPRRFLEPSRADSGELRPVTVLFVNFYPFSAALDQLGDDADTAVRVLNAYYRRAQQVIHRYSGIVNKVDMSTHGDKLMALFGAPLAHEDDPERAVRAALDLRRALDEANAEIAALLGQAAEADAPRFALQQRVGINTGVVFAGRVGSESRHEYTVMGRAVNLAARLMASAADGRVVISPATRRAVERHVVLHDLPPVQLKGIAEPVALAEVQQIREVAREVRSSLARPPLVGRENEVARLMSEARVALGGSGRVFALVGDAGTGKTRLIEDALQRLVRLSHDGALPVFFVYAVECQSYEQNTPYAAARELLGQLFNLIGEDGGRGARELLRRVADLAPEQARFAPLLRDLISLPIEDTPLTAGLSPQQRHDRALDLVEELLLAEARRQPLMMLIDDLHWADASSLELLERLARQAVAAPLLIVLGYRTEPAIAEPWRTLPHCVRIAVGELDTEGGAALLRALLRGEPPPELAGLIERAQGNPFFIEEVVRSLVESGALERGPQGWRLTRAPDELDLPDSIEGVITARLDRLEERSREVLQAASVIGRRFAYQVLTGILIQREDLPVRVRLLIDGELILPEELERDLAYLFKHALTRDVAYGAILYARRRDLHRQVAQQITQLYADRLDDQLALLARHYLLAEDWPTAFDYHLRAGRYAQNRYANREAIELLERALHIRTRQAEQAGQPPAPDPQLVELHERLGVIHALIGEYDTALARYQAALELLRKQASEAEELVRLHHHIARVYEKRAEFDTAFEWVERALALSGGGQSREAVRCLLLGAGLHRRQGRYAQALEWGERARALAEQIGSRREEAQAFKLLGGAYMGMGDNARALELLTHGLQLYEQVQDLDGLSYAHNDLANVYYNLGRLDEASKHYQAGSEIKQMIGDIYGQALIANNLGGVLKLQNQIDEAIQQYQRSLRIFDHLGSVYATGVLHMNLGAAYLLCNDPDCAETHLQQSAHLYEQAGAEDFLPELERYQAELQLKRGNLEDAQRMCSLAITTAVRLKAREEEGISRRVLGQILALKHDLNAAWHELIQSLEILRETASTLEQARTLAAMATVAPVLNRHKEGQSMLQEAVATFATIGARLDLDEIVIIAERHGYELPTT